MKIVRGLFIILKTLEQEFTKIHRLREHVETTRYLRMIHLRLPSSCLSRGARQAFKLKLGN